VKEMEAGCGGGCDGDGDYEGSGAMMVAVAMGLLWWGDHDGGGWRVVASDIWDRIDRVTGNIFGVRRKSSPEKFFGGGDDGGGRRWWWLTAGRRWGGDGVFVCVLFCNK
nr:hypothetical protein [Tanacetum cinerariifolium]